MAALYVTAVMALCLAWLVATVCSIAQVLRKPYRVQQAEDFRHEAGLRLVRTVDRRANAGLPFVGTERRRTRLSAVEQRRQA